MTTAALPLRYLLPRDLQGGIKQLADQEFARLLAAVLAEQQRRGRKLPVSRKTSRKPLIKEVALFLCPLQSSTLFALLENKKVGVEFVGQCDDERNLEWGPLGPVFRNDAGQVVDK